MDPNQPNDIKNRQNNIGWRIFQLEKWMRDLDMRFDRISERMAVRESAITPENIADAVEQIRINRHDINRIERAFGELENIHESDCDAINNRIDAQQLKSQEYYSVAAPKEIQLAFEVIHHTEKELTDLRNRFEEFQLDRVKRLEIANSEINRVRDYVTEVDHKLIEKIDKNQIRSQQYTITIVVGVVITFLSSIIFAYLHV